MLYKKYWTASTLGEAISILEREPNSRPIAGGTDIMVQLHGRQINVDHLVDISRIADLQGIELEGDDLCIGAAVTYQELNDSELVQRHAPLLVDASRSVGAAQVQHMGTIGGNIANASPAGDVLTPLCILGARLVLAGSVGAREVPLAEFIRGVRKTDLHAAELITQVRFHPIQPGEGSSFLKFGLRQSQAVSVVNVACRFQVKDGLIHAPALAVGACAPTVVRSPSAEKLLSGKPPSAALFAEAGEAARVDALPIDDIRGSGQFRRHLVAPLVQRVLNLALERIPGQ
jgi:CO/xanthine dehydrogenase FAD-binding subunit